MKIELRPTASLRPYENNPRDNDDAVPAVAASIREFGFRVPLVITSGGLIVTGHTRWKAATSLGLPKVPVVVVTDLSEEKIRAYRIADNRTGEIAGWDKDLLRLELGELRATDFDLGLLGFSQDDLQALLKLDLNQGLTDPDSVPAPPDEAVTKPGDLWILGKHRLLCGDSCIAADVDRLLDRKPVQLVNTDPPYNVKVEPRSNNAIAAGLSSFTSTHHQAMDAGRDPSKGKATHRKLRAKDRPLANDFVTDEAFDMLLEGWFGNISRVLEPGRSFYIWGGYANCANYPPVLKRHGLYFSQAVIWHKQHPVLTRKDFMGDHEWCFYGWREGGPHVFLGPKNVADVWAVKKVNPNAMVHLTEKPVELATRAMEYSSRPGDRVLDLFGGSGSTLIAAEMTGRCAFLMELDTLYCDVIVKRWEEFTGQKALLESAHAAAPSAKRAAIKTNTRPEPRKKQKPAAAPGRSRASPAGGRTVKRRSA